MILDILELTLTELKARLDVRDITSEQVTKACLEKIEGTKGLNALISVCSESALKQAKVVDIARAKGEKLGPLAGVPIVLKDNINYAGLKTTCASRFLSNNVSVYNATVTERLLDAGAIVLGKANMDEFAMGSSNENSYFGIVKNPHDLACVPGGSSGGSAVSVAANQCFASLGTDTGGSIRQPSSYCGVVGLKPTYGLVSRYGVVAFASSLDQVGPITRSVRDSALMLNVLAGKKDPLDMTNVGSSTDYLKTITGKVSGVRVGVVKQFFQEGLAPEVRAKTEEAIMLLKAGGAIIKEVNLPNIDVALSVYYIISSAEATSNLARFDGIKYGVQAKDYNGLIDLYFKSRTQGFGREVKRRIMLGNYVLSSGYFDAFYRKAKQVQKVIMQEFSTAFKDCDVLIGPTAPTTAFKIGEKISNPLSMYLNDIYTVPVNIAGLPGISIPFKSDNKGLPIGVQLIADKFNEGVIFNVADYIESKLGRAAK